MDNTLRPQKNCVIGLPQCGYVFASQRTCFIGYGFEQSALEVEIVKGLLARENIIAVEAASSIEPGKLFVSRSVV
jgi:hypothetical protein